MRATPRYRARVPIVTARDGSRNRVTSRPLTAPAATPTTAMVTKMAGIGQPPAHRKPSSGLDMPRMEATDRSISPLMMISVIGSVMIAISPLDRPRLNMLLPVRKAGEAAEPMAKMRMTTTARPVSQRSADWTWGGRGRGRRSRSVRLLMTGPPLAQRTGEALGDGLVEGDGDKQQEAPDRLVPERGDAEHVQRRADRGQQQCADGGAGDAAAAAGDL